MYIASALYVVSQIPVRLVSVPVFLSSSDVAVQVFLYRATRFCYCYPFLYSLSCKEKFVMVSPYSYVGVLPRNGYPYGTMYIAPALYMVSQIPVRLVFVPVFLLSSDVAVQVFLYRATRFCYRYPFLSSLLCKENSKNQK